MRCVDCDTSTQEASMGLGCDEVVLTLCLVQVDDGACQTILAIARSTSEVCLAEFINCVYIIVVVSDLYFLSCLIT